MREIIEHKKIILSHGLILSLYPIGKAKIYEIDEVEAEEFGEAIIQISESKRYEYTLSNPAYKLEKSPAIIPSNNTTSGQGNIVPGNYVGTLSLVAVKDEERIPFELEVLATKLDNNDLEEGYRKNYRSMVECITDKCTELLMQANSPVNQKFEPDFKQNSKTIYQRFSFVKSIINSQAFEESLLKIFTSPKTAWKNKEELSDIRSIKKFTNKNIKELLKGTNRIPLPSSHPLYRKGKFESIPTKISSYQQEETLDTPENRFIKHAITTYLWFCEKCIDVFKTDSKDQKEAKNLRNKLESYLNHSFFKMISRPTTLKLNSPTLQRKSGYRQILKSWLMYNLATKLIWKGGEDVYEAGKRDIATLYEYWLFFILYDLFNKKFKFDTLEHNNKPYSHLIAHTKDGLNLIIKSGQHTALSGVVIVKNRALNIKFSFNRTFSGYKDSYPKQGSWTTSMRPDYTLSIWPAELKEAKAEKEESMLHIHFDAKYKVANFKIKTSQQDLKLSEEETKKDLNEIKKQERAGIYKNADLLKMHAYKDAIRRTGGAYILYPGEKESRFKGYHEIIPGLGAFSLNPAHEAKDVAALSSFIDDVIEHLINRASQRENIAVKTYNIHKNNTPNIVEDPIPEYINGKKIIPDETYVLIGFSKNNTRLNWYKENSKYNFRMNDKKGSLIFLPKVVNATFLLLRESGKSQASILYKLKEGIRVFSKEYLKELKHPEAEKDHYLIYEFEKESEDLKFFEGIKWNFKELDAYKRTIEGKNIRSAAGEPFTVSLTELMQVKIND
jgi:predicted component of viral defense system (DUF524 family)